MEVDLVRVLILEDEKQILRYYQSIVESAFEECEVFTATSGKRAISIIKNNKIDLMLLDMELDDEKKVLGLDYANMISCLQPDVDFIIISGYSDYLKDAGDVHPFYYFMKPIDDVFLIRKLLEWEVLRSEGEKLDQKSIRLVTENGMAIVPISHVCFIEKMNRKVKIRTKTKEYVCRDSIKNMLTKLDEHFYHVHQSYIVNMKHIESVEVKEDRTWGIKFGGLEEEAILSRYKAKHFFEEFTGAFK